MERQGAIAILVLATVLGGCASTPPEIRDSAPTAPPPGLANLPDASDLDRMDLCVTKKSQRGNSPYVVFAKRYQVMDSAAGYRRIGQASWYGRKFHGRATSSGEIYDMYKLTAAHRTLPIPVCVRVTNLDNGKSTIVRVNDRGPFHPRRIIDLSYAAAVKLDFSDEGIARVSVETVLPEDLVPPPPAKQFFIHAGPFANFNGARATSDELATILKTAISVVKIQGALVVRIGPLSTRGDAERLRALLAFHDGAFQRKRAPVIVEE